MEFLMGAVAIVVAALSIIAWHFICRRSSSPLNWPVVGMMPALLWNIDNIYNYATKLVVDNGGTFKFRGPWMTRDNFFEVVTSNPANLEYILKKDFANFPSGPYVKDVFYDIFGDGLFTADDELWKRQRKAVAMALSSATFRDRNLFVLHKIVQEKLLPALRLAKEKKAEIDLQDILLRFNFDSICMSVLGRDSCCLGDDILPEISIARIFHQAVELCTYRAMLPPVIWKFMRFLNVGFEKKLCKTSAIIGEFAAEMIEARIKEIEAEGGLSGDILSNFIEMEADERRSPSQKLLQGLILSVFLAGLDTSSSALSWFFWLVSTHPNVEEKIVSEITQILKSKPLINNNKNEMGFLDLKDLRGMNYLQAALSESMRLFPPVPVIYREATKKTSCRMVPN
ncbi:hypothetical protein KI387_043309 [Taxus chinensis]|uniref:Cytochrome P450 n=1 Tax=Taxus chinensis TaxID=29808 RepID=A0AA38BZC7_TAXCH|nr:hypothetical protein KI387_043309 [Taxus chinensis]